MLEFYARQFDTVEINNTFYRMPSAATVANWAAQVPDGFAFALKASRRITHLSRLEGVGEALGLFLERASLLGDKLGPLLFQLPPTLRRDLQRLEAFLALLPDDRRVAMEFRHRSWFDDAVYEALRRHRVGLCVTDGEIKGGEVPFVATAGWGYLRLRGVAYDDEALQGWVDRVRAQSWSEVFLYFKHENEAEGPRLALRFVERLRASP
jgi:uncharacterized protein YecE (DUF72 family)